MKPLKVIIIDYGLGNLHSVSKALESVGAQPEITSDFHKLLKAEAAILPGVGAGDAAMRALWERGLVEPIRQIIARGTPFLGVCLGLQLLMDATEEGNARCLGVVSGRVRRLPDGLKVPHMGWNKVDLIKEHPLFQDVPQGSYFYFVHSYYAEPKDKTVIGGLTEYGIHLCSVIIGGNLVATQFHPEKSGTLGLKIYENFVRFAYT